MWHCQRSAEHHVLNDFVYDFGCNSAVWLAEYHVRVYLHTKSFGYVTLPADCRVSHLASSFDHNFGNVTQSVLLRGHGSAIARDVILLERPPIMHTEQTFDIEAQFIMHKQFATHHLFS